MATFAVIYRYSDDTAARDEHRAAHRAFLNGQSSTLLSGPLGEPDGALILVQADSVSAVEGLLADDPFQREGIVDEVVIRAFTPAGGAHADAFTVGA